MGRKREEKIAELIQARAELAGIGIRKAKVALNKLAKSDGYARALRTAPENRTGETRSER